MESRGVYAYDIEVFPNLFTLVAIDVDTDEVFSFAILENDNLNHSPALFDFLWRKPKFIGWNNLDYDGPITEFIWRKKCADARKIYEYATEVFNAKSSRDLEYNVWNFSFNHLDLMNMLHYTIYGFPTSLKWCEFTTRQQKMQDLPISPTTEVPENRVDDVLRYNKYDVQITKYMYDINKWKIELRNELSLEYDDTFIVNQADSSIGEKIILYRYCEHTGKQPKYVRKTYTKRTKLNVADVILPYIEFETPIFQEVKRDFENLTLKADSTGSIKLTGAYEKIVDFRGIEITYALGGLHGCVEPGEYSSDDKYIIKSCDVTSMYPSLAIANKFYPEHLGEEFCDVYKAILDERKRYPKDTHFGRNYMFKIAANAVYGKSNSRHNGFLKDPRYTIQTTVNGQLLLSLLAERLSDIGELLILNTDGLEIKIPRKKEKEYFKICDEWCNLTGIELEHDEYESIWVKDVNNYIAKFINGKVKRKGTFAIYEDYDGFWHKNPSALIIPLAVNEYFINGIDPSQTIESCDNIHEFLYGIKGGKNFEYWLVEVRDNVIHNISKHNERALRYYISTDGHNLLKNWTGGKKFESGDVPSAVPGTKGQSVQLLQNIRDKEGRIFRTKKVDGEITLESRYPDLDYQYYIGEAWKLIHIIEN